MSNAAKNFDILATSLNALHNYFDDLTQLISDRYLAKFLDTLTRSCFPCRIRRHLHLLYRIQNVIEAKNSECYRKLMYLSSIAK